jgi:amino acid adenylation domain-containing protein
MNATVLLSPESLSARRAALNPAQQALLAKRLQGKTNGLPLQDGIPPRGGNGPAVLSFAQQRLWFLDQLAPGNPFYNIPVPIRLSFDLSVPVLEGCVNEIVRRHESLRTTFGTADGEPVQVIASSLNIPLAVEDLRAISGEEREKHLRLRITEDSRKPFDLAAGPLLRTSLYRLGNTEHVFLIVLHHVISDGWSIGIFLRELTALYTAFACGQPSPLSPLPIQYPDFAEWQRGWLQGEVLKKQVAYWKEQLADLPVLNLPTDRPRPAVQSYCGAHHAVTIPRPLTSALNALSQRSGVTLFMTLLAAFQTLLHRSTRQEDIVVGAPIAGRNRGEIEGLIGFFVNSLVLRANCSGEPTFLEFLKRVHRTALEAYAHQDLPFEMLVEELQPERQLSRNPLFQVTFQLFNAPTLAVNGEPSIIVPLEIERGTAIFDIAFSLFETADGLGGGWEYNTDLFDATTIARMARHFQTLLQQIVANPALPLTDYALLDASEKRELLIDWNKTERAYPKDALLHRLVEAQVERTPDAVAVVFGEKEISYCELNRRANQLARHLRQIGARRDVPVAVCQDRSIEMVISLLAVLKAGSAYVPLDPVYPEERLNFMLSDAGAAVVLTTKELPPGVTASSVQRMLAHEDSAWATQSGENLEVERTPEDLAYVIYTSGSTGRPHGAMIPHRAICNHMLWMQETFPLKAENRVLQRTASSFDASVWEFWAPLLAGARLVMHEPEKHPDPANLVRAIRRHGITTIQMVPSLLKLVLLEPGISECRTLRRVFCGGEALPAELAEMFFARLPCTLTNLYGPTECTIDSTFHACEPGEIRAIVPIGRPIANVRHYVLDARSQPVPVGVPGELHIGGACVGRGYLNRPKLTEERFIIDPFSDSPSRLYKTGDLVRYLGTGNIEFLGRIDHQVKIRGFRIELGEIESVLRQHSAVADAVVTARESDQGGQRLLAYVVPAREGKGGQPLDTEAWSGQQVTQWRRVYDEAIYSGLSESSFNDQALDFAGWNSSFTGQPIPVDEMREWLERTTETIRALEPQRVLEIGCGTGLILFNIAPNCKEYVGIDFSAPAVEYVNRRIARGGDELKHARAFQRTAEDLDGLGSGLFDTIILNSVAQYFPNIEYLLRVLQKAVARLQPEGSILIGDVRSLPLLTALQTSLEFSKAPESLAVQELRRRIENASEQDEELVVDPAFFKALPQILPPIGSVQVQLKRGRYLNELSRFRYDVILRAGEPAQDAAPNLAWRDWSKQSLTLDRVREEIALGRPAWFGARDVSNARLAFETRLLESIAAAGENTTISDLRAPTAELSRTEVHPEDWWDLGAELGYKVDVRWSNESDSGAYDVLLRRCEPDEEPRELASLFPAESLVRKPWSYYANNPLQALFSRKLAPLLREFLSERLPEYMVPSGILVLETLPLMPNGKIDRKALPALDTDRPDLQRAFVAPRTAVEEVLAGLWAGVIELKSVGVHDNFFTELGGHSLLATQLVTRIRETFPAEVPLRRIFEAPTVAEFAALLLQNPEERARIERTAQLILEMMEMSDEEVEQRLATETFEEPAPALST